MLLPSPQWLHSGNNAWQLAAATFVGLQSIPDLTIHYGGLVKKKWAINSALTLNKLQTSALIKKVDDTLGLDDRRAGQSRHSSLHRHRQECAWRQRDGLALWQFAQLKLQAEAAGYIIVLNAVATFVILKIIASFVPLRMDARMLEIGRSTDSGY
jgi:ammonia channel protein AmtB